jgi:hypothetical protein
MIASTNAELDTKTRASAGMGTLRTRAIIIARNASASTALSMESFLPNLYHLQS